MRCYLRSPVEACGLAVLFGIAFLLAPVYLPAPFAHAEPQAGICACPTPDVQIRPVDPQKPKFSEARLKLDMADETAALKALHVGLTEAGDGSTFFWHRGHGRLRGTVRPKSSFIDAKGRVCRHLVVTLATPEYRRSVEGVACRLPDGSWTLEG